MLKGQLFTFLKFFLPAFFSLVLVFNARSQEYGCTDPQAINYNPRAAVNDGSCDYNTDNSNLSLIISPLPESVTETSGLIYYLGGLWTHNDSGGLPEIYKIDTLSGQIIQIILLEGAENIDWEDIAQDDDFIYVGDFGNNAGNRRDLHIYRVAKSMIPALGNVSVKSTRINYNYSDQHSFADAPYKHNFDCEAMICAGDSLYLFTKRWVDHRSMMYVLPKSPGTYVAMVRDSLEAGGLITGADISELYGEVSLVGYNNYLPLMWLLFDYKDHDFLKGNKRKFNFPGQLGTQTEGIAYSYGRNVYVSSEKTSVYSQRVYRLNTAKWTYKSMTGRNTTDF